MSNSNYLYSNNKNLTNSIIDVSVSNSNLILTLDETKVHLRVDFTADDGYISTLIDMCQSKIEQHCGISLSERQVIATINNIEGNSELPFGPLITITLMEDEDENEITDYVIKGNLFGLVKSPCSNYLHVEYQAGFTDCNLPSSLKLALLAEIAWRYENRGDEILQYRVDTPGICAGAEFLCRPYKRYSTIL